MGRKLRRDGFIDGSMISYFSIVFTKILGALYVIPFTYLVGPQGMVIFSVAYLIYNITLNASTSGIPTAMSVLISEQNAKGLHRTKWKFYRVGMIFTVGVGVVLFILVQIFAPALSNFYINRLAAGDAAVSVHQVQNAVRVISFCLLVVPFLAIFRGFLQGQKVLAVSAYSQIIEQVLRIAVVLVGAALAIRVFDWGVPAAINIAVAGAGVGALAAVVFLKMKARGNDDVLAKHSDETDIPGWKTILKRFLAISIPVLIVAISGDLYDIIDNMLVVFSLSRLGYEGPLLIGSIISTFAPKISMIVFSLSMGLSAGIVPALAAHVAKGEYKDANQKLCTAINIILAISLPISVMISILSTPVYALFYGTNGAEHGGIIIRFLIVISVLTSIKVMLCMSMQGLRKTKTVCIATITGILISTLLGAPAIFLLNYLGFGGMSYVGAFFTRVLGQGICVAIILRSLRKSHNFRYGSILRTFSKVVPAAGAMAAAILLLGLFLPVPQARGFSQLLLLAVYGVVGGGIYLIISLKTGLISDVFGKNAVSKVLNKIGPGRRS